ncbi:MAG TPA: class I SAM-dependent methyltransferase [Pyrinomonadaceae bacterium]|jgi:SAM-dependent methyltransferase
MFEAASGVRADFDRIALLADEGWDHSAQYHDFLLRRVPSPCGEALEVGCGSGAFSRLLAGAARRVVALDLSPNMIRVARERSAAFPNIEFRVTDVLESELPAEGFDCVVTVATLHHLPPAAALLKMKGALKPGGVLLILDLFRPAGPFDAALSALAAPAGAGLRLLRQGRLRAPREVRRAWAEHGRRDTYLTLAGARELYARLLPGAEVRRRLLWRYSVVWRKGRRALT